MLLLRAICCETVSHSGAPSPRRTDCPGKFKEFQIQIWREDLEHQWERPDPHAHPKPRPKSCKSNVKAADLAGRFWKRGLSVSGGLCVLLSNVLCCLSCFRKLGIPHGHLADSPMVCCQYELYFIKNSLLSCQKCKIRCHNFHSGLFPLLFVTLLCENRTTGSLLPITKRLCTVSLFVLLFFFLFFRFEAHLHQYDCHTASLLNSGLGDV